MNIKFCPSCDEEIEIPDTAEQVECTSCFRKFRVEADADFEDGMWRDRTQLIAIE